MTKSIWYFLVVAAGLCRCWGGDQAQWGEAWSRNMVSTETNLPADFSPKSGKNIKWAAELGTETYSTPIVAGHRVYIGTNNQNPRDRAHLSDCGVLMCFDEHSGKFLWQLAVPKREEDPYHDWPKTGMPSPVTVESNYVYLVSNRGEVMCLDAEGMTNGNDGSYRDEAAHMIPRTTNSIAKIVSEVGPANADILWLTDLTKQADIWSHDGAHSSILINGEHLYLNSGTGVDNTHKVIRSSNAPSLLVLNKRTGEIIARDREHIAPDIFHCTWSSPSLGKVDGKNMLFFGAGNGHLYSFETLPAGYNKGPGTDSIALKKIWSIDFDPAAPKQDIHKYLSNRREGPSNFYGMPVFLNGRIYVAAGGDLWWGKNQAWLKCYDAAKGELGTKAEVWSCPLERHVLGTPAVYRDMVFIADCGRRMHCINALNGEPIWTHELNGEVWASPMVADGRVYIGTRSGELLVFSAEKEKRLLDTIDFGSPISSTVTIADGALFIATMNKLYCVKQEGTGVF